MIACPPTLRLETVRVATPAPLIVALSMGLVAFGVYCFFDARYRKLIDTLGLPNRAAAR